MWSAMVWTHTGWIELPLIWWATSLHVTLPLVSLRTLCTSVWRNVDCRWNNSDCIVAFFLSSSEAMAHSFFNLDLSTGSLWFCARYILLKACCWVNVALHRALEVNTVSPLSFRTFPLCPFGPFPFVLSDLSGEIYVVHSGLPLLSLCSGDKDGSM